MKQSTISLLLFFLILSSSPAQRGWRSFDQFGWIIQIHQSTDHSLWFVGIDGIWHLNAGGWQQVPHASAFVFEDNAGALWVAGPNSQGLWHFDADEGWQQETQVTGIVSSIYQQADGTLWVGGDAVWRYDQSGWQQQQGSTGGSGVIQIDQDGILWIGNAAGLWRYDQSGWQPVAEITSGVLAIYEDPDSVLWMGGHNLIWRYDGSGWQPQPLNTGRVFLIYEDSNGVLWMGGEKGLWRQSKGATGQEDVWFHFDQTNYNEQLGLPNSFVLAIHQRPDGSLWLGSPTSGLVEYKPGRHSPKVEILSVDGNADEPLPKDYVTGYSSLAFKWTADDMETLTEYISYQYKIDGQQWVKTPIQQVNTPVLNDGYHTFSLRAIDYDGISSQIATFSFTVDTVRPSVLIAKPVPNQVVGDNVPIHGSILDTDLLAYRVEFRSLATDTFQLIASGNKVQTFSILANWKTQSLLDGAYQVRVIATDQLEHSKEHQVDITLDNTPPVVSLQMPQANQKLSGGLKIAAQANDLHLHQYQLKYTQDLPLTAKSEWESIQTSAQALSASPAQIDHTWNSVAVFGSTLIRLLVQDRAGNQQTADVIVDLANQRAKPGVQIAQPQAKQVLKDTVAIIGTATDYGYSTLDSYQLSIAAGQNPSRWTLIHQDSSQVSDNVLGSWDTQKQQDGLYSLRLSASNSKGYLNSQQIIVIVDNSPPVALISPPGPEWIASQQVQIRGTASDDNFQQYRLEYEDRSNPASWSIIGATSRQAVEKGILQLWRTGGLDDGQYQLRLTVTDQAGNQTQTIQTLTLDNQKPEVKLTAPAEEAVVSGAIQITGVITDDNLKDYQLEVQLVSRPTGWERIGAGDSVTAGSEQLGQWNTRQVKDGSYHIQLTATDQTGQPSQSTRLVTVDKYATSSRDYLATIE